MNDVEAAREFWKDHVARLTTGKELRDPFLAGLDQGRKQKFNDMVVIRAGLQRLIEDTELESDLQQRAHKLLHTLREQHEQEGKDAL